MPSSPLWHGRARARCLDSARMKQPPAQNIADLRAMAKRRLPRALFEYVDRGAEDEIAIDTNRHALEQIKLRPRVLRGVAVRSAQQMLWGKPMALPIAIAPTAVAGMLWHDGDVQSARAAVAAGIPYTLSTFSVTALEKVAEGAPGGRLWFQLYVMNDRDHMRQLVRRAWNAGYEALMVTVDGPVAPKREYNIRNGFNMPITWGPRLMWDFATHPRWLLGVAARYKLTTGIPGMVHHSTGLSSVKDPNKSDASLDWGTIRELRALFPGKLLLKGILHPDDARMALDAGVDGVIVSNHGGRSLDASIATIDALPDVLLAVEGKLPVLVDSAFYRGSDIVKALAMGAAAVLVGRAAVWGVAASGQAGVSHAIGILGEEIDRVMAQTGFTQLSELSPHLIWRPRD